MSALKPIWVMVGKQSLRKRFRSVCAVSETWEEGFWLRRVRTAGPAIRPALRCAITRGPRMADGVYKLHNYSAEASVPSR